MTRPTLVTLLAVFAAAGGCAFPDLPALSLNPIDTDSVRITDPRVEGTWVWEGDTHEVYRFEAADSNRYRFEDLDDDSVVATYQAALVRLGDYTYLDLGPPKDDVQTLAIPVHVISRLAIVGDTLHLTWLDATGWETLAATDHLSLPHAHAGKDLVLTASSEDLQHYLTTHYRALAFATEFSTTHHYVHAELLRRRP